MPIKRIYLEYFVDVFSLVLVHAKIMGSHNLF